MPHAYAVRITHSYDVAKPIIDVWKYSVEKLLVYEHVGSATEKVHIHCIIEGSEYTKKWLRELGARQGINLKGNKFCSMKDYDGDRRAIVYMTKGIHDPKFNQGYSAEDIALWKSQWEEKPKSKDEAAYNRMFADTKYMEQAYEDYKQENPPDKMDLYHKFKWLKKTAYHHALMHNGYIANIKTINEYKMLVYTYCARNGVQIPADDSAFKRFD